jgi:sensor histidine kinase regulating citrate/malate metabolism
MRKFNLFILEDDDQDYNINVRSYPLIPKDVQLQLFQRSFSTKGMGRGWGTYSIRLLTERYLGAGLISFRTKNTGQYLP